MVARTVQLGFTYARLGLPQRFVCLFVCACLFVCLLVYSFAVCVWFRLAPLRARALARAKRHFCLNSPVPEAQGAVDYVLFLFCHRRVAHIGLSSQVRKPLRDVRSEACTVRCTWGLYCRAWWFLRALIEIIVLPTHMVRIGLRGIACVVRTREK